MYGDRRQTKRVGFVVLLSVLPLFCTSCRVTSQAVVRSQQAHDYDRLDIIYQAHSASGPMFFPAPTIPLTESPTGIIQVSAEVPVEPAPFPRMNWSKPELRIEYPHPDGRQDYARVTLYFLPVDCGHQCDRLSWGQQFEERIGLQRTRFETFRERWYGDRCRSAPAGSTFAEMDLARCELDGLLRELKMHGFFEGTGNASASQLEVRLNRHWTSKSWKYEPALDELTTRAYREGRFRTVTDDQATWPGLWTSLPWFSSSAHSK